MQVVCRGWMADALHGRVWRAAD